MPLLNKKPFVRNKVNLDELKDSDELFYCAQTGEAFDNYEDFCERVYLCNALQWSCSYTGKNSLTYKEALESEESAKKMLKEFPMELRLPILYLTQLTSRTTLRDLADDILAFVRNRFFVGEMVEVQVKDAWKECHILQVHLPSTGDMKKAASEFEKNKNPRKFFPPENLFKYEVEVLNDDTSAAVMDKDSLITVAADKVRRKKYVYTQEKNRLFLRQFVENDCPNGKGIWKVKEAVIKKYNLEQVQWSKLFVGSVPRFHQQAVKTPPSSSSTGGSRKSQQQSTLDHFVTKKSSPTKVNGTNSSKADAAATKAAREAKEKETAERKRITLEEIARKQKEEKLQMQEKKKQDKLKLAEFMKEYQRKKEDLELEDLKDLPEPCPIQMKLPNKYFGHLVQILEFVNGFDKFVGQKRFFPKGHNHPGLTFDTLEKALLESEVEGPLNDLLQMFLSAVYNVLELEDEEIDDSSKSRFVQNGTMDKIITESSDGELNRLAELANRAQNWAMHTQGCNFAQIPVDYYTITEVLRLHLLCSGGRVNDAVLRWRYEQRGGYRVFDDPGVLFRQKRPDVMEQLAVKSVYELSLDDKLEIVQVLIDQTLTYAHVRDMIDENVEKARQNRADYRLHHSAQMKKEREEVFKLKEQKKEIKEKEKLEEIDREIAEMSEKTRDKLQSEYIRTAAGRCGPQQLALGYDRAFRRYWLFKYVPGLYVEHNPEHYVGECIPGGTPCIDKMNMPDSDTLEYMKRLFEDSNNKENLGNRATTVKDILSTPVKNFVREGVTAEEKQKPRVAWVCSGLMSTCQVHNFKPGQTVWYYYKSEDDISRLIATLSDRGLREHELKEALNQERGRILKSLPNVPFFVSNIVENMEVDSSDGNHSFVLDLALRDQLLDLEYKITAGGLGTLRVSNVSEWRKELEEGEFDESLPVHWPKESEIPEIPEQEHKSVEDLLKTEHKFVDILDAVYDSTLSFSSKLQGLKIALLQLEQCVARKYIGRPLGVGKPSRKVVRQVSNLALKWEASLRRCTSLSQVFIHLTTLEKSIQWSKSLLKTNCKLCKTRADPDQMLLCDSCDKGFHTYCLTPKLKKIPEGDWHCPTCKPIEKQPKAKKTPKPSEPVEEEKKTVVGKCKVCLDRVPLITCDACSGGYHMACLEPPLRKIPRGKWTCQPCRRLSAVMRREEEEESEVGEALRSSHRRSSRAASSRISHIAQQILSNRSDDDESGDERNNSSLSSPPVAERKRKSRYSVEPVASDLPLDNAVLQEILDELMHDPSAWPFLRPVSKNDVPDYHLIITNPMDFGTIKHKLNMFEYRNNSEVLYDCNLVFDNCFAYNKEGSEIYESGERLKTLYENICKQRHLFYIEEDMSPDSKQSKRRKK